MQVETESSPVDEFRLSATKVGWTAGPECGEAGRPGTRQKIFPSQTTAINTSYFEERF